MSDTESPAIVHDRAALRKPELYVDKLRLEDPEKLTQLCKLYLSFLFDNTTAEEFDQLLGENQKVISKGKRMPLLGKSRKSFGSSNDLDVFVERGSLVQLNFELRAVDQLATFLRNSQNLTQEGIFRKTGNINRQKELKQKLAEPQSVDLSGGYYTTHDCASVLKTILSELPDALLHEKLYNAHLYAIDIKDEERRKKVVCLLLQMMSSSHFAIAKKVFTLLHRVSQNAAQNLMNADNLGALFAPHMLCPKKMSGADFQTQTSKMQLAVSFIITHTESLFKVTQLLGQDAYHHLKKTNLSLSIADSPVSVTSSSSSDCAMSARKRKMSRCAIEDEDEEAIDTIVTFANRNLSEKPQDTTQMELAKLSAHVASMQDNSEMKALFLKRVSEKQKTDEKKKRCRTKSLGESIKRRFSRRMRPKSVNMNVGELVTKHVLDSGVDKKSQPATNSSAQTPPRVLPAKLNNEIKLLCASPYQVHRSYVKSQLRMQANAGTPEKIRKILGEENFSPDVRNCSPRIVNSGRIENDQQVPHIRKPLLPTNTANTPENKHLNLKKSKATQLIRYQRLSDAQDHIATPPRPTKPLVAVGTGLIV